MRAPIDRGSWFRLAAEFVVIVVGVLVALAVDEWSAERSDRRSEAAYLVALSEDLRVDSVAFHDVLVPNIVGAEQAIRAIVPIATGAEDIAADTLDFLRLVIEASHGFTQLGTRTAFDELLATGSLRLLSSADLRSRIVEYYGVKTLVAARADARASGYAILVRGYLPIEFDYEASDASIQRFGAEKAASLVREPRFVEIMNRQRNYLGLVRPLLEDLLGRVEALLREVDEEVRRVR